MENLTINEALRIDRVVQKLDCCAMGSSASDASASSSTQWLEKSYNILCGPALSTMIVVWLVQAVNINPHQKNRSRPYIHHRC